MLTRELSKLIINSMNHTGGPTNQLVRISRTVNHISNVNNNTLTAVSHAGVRLKVCNDGHDNVDCDRDWPIIINQSPTNEGSSAFALLLPPYQQHHSLKKRRQVFAGKKETTPTTVVVRVARTTHHIHNLRPTLPVDVVADTNGRKKKIRHVLHEQKSSCIANK